MIRPRTGIAVLAVSLGGAYLGWYHETQYPLRSAGAPALTLLIPAGASTGAIGRKLADLGLVRHPLVFRALVHLKGAGGRLRAGEYSIDGGLSLDQIVDKIRKGEVVHHDITFPEGKSLEEMAALAARHGLDPAGFLAAASDASAIRDLDPAARDLEGYLFPDTYDVARTPDAPFALVARMVQRFRTVIVPELPLLAEHGLPLHELVTLASLVELETAQPEERPRIAAVFLNRLQRHMPLQADPTVIYALRKAGGYDGNIHKKDLGLDSPYNTYRYPGLPPGPIASPGREALLAVLYPAPVKDLYFVSRNDGTHEFSETLAQHERAVDRYQRQRGGGR